MKSLAVALSLVAALGGATARADTNFPSRPITLIVGAAAGGGLDAQTRFVARKMSDVLGQSVVVENKASGAEILAISSVAKANPDGYTMLMCSSVLTINPNLHANLPYVRSELRPIGRVGTSSLLVVAQASEPYRDFAEMIAFAKANPTKLSYGTPGTGTGHHMAMELIKSTTGAPIQHVPYRGAAPGMNDLLAGVIPLLVSSAFAAEPHIKSGKVRALVTTNPTRLPQLDQVPTLGEALPGHEVNSWAGVFVPAGVPQAIADKLSNALKTVLNDPQIAEQLGKIGTFPRWLAPADLNAMMDKEEARWADVIKKAGIKAE